MKNIKSMKNIFLIILSVLLISNPLVIAMENGKSSNSVDFSEPEDIIYIKDKNDLEQFTSNLDNMTADELQLVISSFNWYIQNYGNINSSNNANHNEIYAVDQMAVAAWIAAANIAKLTGYNCAGTIVEKSVQGYNYTEGTIYSDGKNGICGTKIKDTNSFRSINKSINGKEAFKKSDNSDLYYAIHKYTYSPIFMYGHVVAIHDIFDFRAEDNFNELFTKLVNNFAALSMYLGILRKINVTIYVK